MNICTKCDINIKNSENFRRHTRVCDGQGTLEDKCPGPRTCKYCSKKFNNRANHNRHVVYCSRIEGISLQEEYDSGLSIRQICEKYNLSPKFVGNILTNKRNGWEVVAKIKKENLDNFFFGGTRRRSKGEQEFEKLLESSGISKLYRIEKQYHLLRYRLDFAFADIKLDVEIDGMQHYTKRKVIQRDRTRETALTTHGWTIYRIASKDFLARPNVVFKLFKEFIKEKHPCKVFRYNGQIVDGDKKWAKDREEKILNSNINFNKLGWRKELSRLLKITPSPALRWVQSNMPKFYKEKCRTPRADYTKKNLCKTIKQTKN